MDIGYARVSTKEQNIALQVDALAAAGCDKIFKDEGVSGARIARPALNQALEHLRAGDALVVWRLDRLSRGTRHVLGFIEELAARGVAFRSLTETLDSSGPMGKVLLTVIAAFAEMEREVLIERTRAGLAAARARGRRGGRPRSLTAQQDLAIRSLYDARQNSVASIAEMFTVSESTVWRSLAKSAVEEVRHD